MANLIPILAGVGIIAFISKKRKKKKVKEAFSVFDSDCKVSQKDPPKNAEEAYEMAEQLSDYVMRIVEGAFKSLDIEKLGEPPGEESNNKDFVHAAATRAFKSSVPSGCIKMMGVPSDFGADTNSFGPDFTDWNGKWPGDSREWFKTIVENLSQGIDSQGYEFGPTQAVARVYSGDGKAPSPVDSIVNFIIRKR